MKAIKFKECNTEIGKNQEEYLTLPSLYDKKNGIVVSCYKLSFKDMIKILFTRKIWVSIMVFNGPLQPQMLSVNKKQVIIKK